MFNTTTSNPAKDVIILFIKQNCEMCRLFQKTFEAVAEQFTQVSDLEFAVIDMSKNKIEGIEHQFYPHASLYKITMKSTPVDYDSGTDISQLVDFLKKHASVELYKEFQQPGSKSTDEL